MNFLAYPIIYCSPYENILYVLSMSQRIPYIYMCVIYIYMCVCILSTHIYGIRGRNTPHQISFSFFSGNRASTLSRLRIISPNWLECCCTKHNTNQTWMRFEWISWTKYHTPYYFIRICFSRRLYAEESARLSASENRFSHKKISGFTEIRIKSTIRRTIIVRLSSLKWEFSKWTAFFSVFVCTRECLKCKT